MEIVRFADARPYVAPKHFDMRSFRLQGEKASSAETCWVGLSQFLPGGGADHGATPVEKIYVVLSGEITITVEEGEFTLGELDSCVIKANEARSIVNNSHHVATMLVIMQYPKE
jgi:quercetin dioxygenase-like cupin family protein